MCTYLVYCMYIVVVCETMSNPSKGAIDNIIKYINIIIVGPYVHSAAYPRNCQYLCC